MTWPMVKLVDVCTITMGQAPEGSSYNETGDGLALIAGAGDFGELVPQPKKFTTSPSKISKSGDLILCIRATIGDLNWSDSEYCLGRGVSGLRPSKNLDANYLWYFITANKEQLASKGTGSTFKQVSKVIISDWEIPLPPLEEQKRLAAILDKADAIRRKRQQAIKLADDFLRAVFLDMFGDPVTNPKGWEKGRFGDVIEVLTDYHANGSYETLNNNVTLLDEPCYAYMVRTTDLEKKNYTDGVKYIDEHAYNYLHKTKMFGGEIIINKIGSAGSVYLMPTIDIPASLAMNQFMIRCSDKVLNEFFYYQLLTKASKREISKRVQGAVTKTITKDAVREIPVIIPPHELQKKFIVIANSFKSSIDKKFGEGKVNVNGLFGALSLKAFSGGL